MFGDQEKAVPKYTIYRMLVGGFRDGKWQGAHKHNGLKIRYLADPKRLTITDIEVTRPDGSTDKFTAKDVKTPAGAQWYEMGCTDCHNRPAHRFSTPEWVVDRALARGAIDKDLPFIKREAVAVLKTSYPSQEEARKGIPAAMLASYSKLVPALDAAGKAKVEAAGKLLAAEWTHNNFPDMKVTWGTYAEFLGHEPGCFRCHDKNHQNVKGDAVQKRCSGSCHDVIATDEEKPEAHGRAVPLGRPGGSPWLAGQRLEHQGEVLPGPPGRPVHADGAGVIGDEVGVERPPEISSAPRPGSPTR